MTVSLGRLKVLRRSLDSEEEKEAGGKVLDQNLKVISLAPPSEQLSKL